MIRHPSGSSLARKILTSPYLISPTTGDPQPHRPYHLSRTQPTKTNTQISCARSEDTVRDSTLEHSASRPSHIYSTNFYTHTFSLNIAATRPKPPSQQQEDQLARNRTKTIMSANKPTTIQTRGVLIRSPQQADNGDFVPSFAWAEIDSVVTGKDMVIQPHAIRLKLPAGVKRRECDHEDLMGKVLRMFHKSFPDAELPEIEFPVGANDKSLSRFIDLIPGDDSVRPITIAKTATTKWKLNNSNLQPPFFLGPSLPDNVIAVEILGIQKRDLSNFYATADSFIETQLDPFSNTTSKLLDIWKVEKEFIKGLWTPFSSVLVIQVCAQAPDTDVMPAVAAAKPWPGFYPQPRRQPHLHPSFRQPLPLLPRVQTPSRQPSTLPPRHPSPNQRLRKDRLHNLRGPGSLRVILPRQDQFDYPSSSQHEGQRRS